MLIDFISEYIFSSAHNFIWCALFRLLKDDKYSFVPSKLKNNRSHKLYNIKLYGMIRYTNKRHLRQIALHPYKTILHVWSGAFL